MINIDDPLVDLDEETLPMLPLIKICDSELTGFVGPDEVRNSIMTALMKPCYPE